MARFHLVRVGALGHVGRFASVDATRYRRRSRVIVRSSRGLEIGEVLSPPAADEPSDQMDGSILRLMSVEDRLLEARLLKNRGAAYDACSAWLTARGLPAQLMDVEHLFDGQSLVFYFLGEQPAELGAVVEELAELYDAQAQFRQFADVLTSGCGPGCGTEAAEGGGCGSCATGCAIAEACRPKA
jgi:cell fate regulator YaaT (PSP1 superfamily)